MTRQRVLMVGINYAPEHTGIAPYTTAAAEHLAHQEQDVVMHTGIPHYPDWRVPPTYRWKPSVSGVQAGVTVHRHRHFVPRRQDILRRGLYELSFALQFAVRSRRERPDVVVAVVPSLLSAIAAARLARRTGARLILWIQDSMGAAVKQSGVPGGRLVARTVVRLEQSLFNQAEWVFVASEAFRGHVQAAGISPERIVQLPNWVHIEAPSASPAVVRHQLGWADDETVVLHTGNMGFKQDLARVVDAARISGRGRTDVRYVLMGDGSQRAQLEEQAAGVRGVQILDPVSSADYVNVLAAADVLLINERHGVVDMSMPSKLTSYFAAGRPVIACVDPSGGTAAEVMRSEAGMLTSAQTPEALVEAVVSMVADPERARVLGENGRLYAEGHLSAKASLDLISNAVTSRESDESSWSPDAAVPAGNVMN